MAIAITNIGTNSNTSGATLAIASITVPSGAVIVFFVDEFSSTIGGSVADGASNSYSSLSSNFNNNSSGAGFGNLFHSTTGNALSAQNITYTKQTSGDAAACTAVYVTGQQASSPLDSAVTTKAFGSSSSPSVTSGTPAVSGELFIGFTCYSSAAQTFTTDTGNGWATPPNAKQGTTTNAVGGGSLVNGGTGTKTFNPSLTASSNWACFVIGYKPIPTTLFTAMDIDGLGSGGPFFRRTLAGY